MPFCMVVCLSLLQYLCFFTLVEHFPLAFTTNISYRAAKILRHWWTYLLSNVIKYSWPPACAGRVMKKFDWVLNYELLNAIGAKWVLCLGRKGARVGFPPLCPALPRTQTSCSDEKGLRSSSYPMSHSPVLLWGTQLAHALVIYHISPFPL